MHRPVFPHGSRPLGLTAALLVSGLVAAAPALAVPEDKLECPGKQELVRIDAKVCPPNPNRPAITMQRRCCRTPGDKVICHPFRPCPPRSPS